MLFRSLVNPTTTVGGKLVLKEGTTNGTNAITVKAPDNIASNVSFTLPSADGTNGQILTTNGSGVLSFASAAASSFTISDNQGTPNTDSFSTGGTLTFAGTANQITTTVSNDTITFSLPTDVSITGDLTVSGNDIKMNGGTTALTFSGSGDVAVAGDVTVTGNDIKMSGGTTALTFSGSGDVAVAGDLKVAGNDIKASDGTTAITMSSADVTIAGDVTVSGNDIKMNGGTTALTFSGSGDVAVAGDLTVTGNDIKASGGTTALTFSSADVTVAGDLTVSGNDVKMSGGTTALTFSGSGDVAVAGDLKVGGNDIKASDGTTAITMSGANVTIAGDLTVSGTTTTVSSTTVTVNDPLIALANNNTATDAVDIGFYGTYDTSGSLDLYSGLFRDASDGKYRLYKDSQSAPTTTVNISATGYTVATLVANLEGGTVSSLASAITVPNGGTGAATFTSNGILYGNGTNAIQVTAAGTAGYFLYSNAGTPAWTNTIDGGTY